MTSHKKPLDSLLETVGKTPLVKIRKSPAEVPVYAKIETFNPGSSVKDRIGMYMLKKMLDRGDIKPGGTIIEPTAGNTGIGIAIAANLLNLNAVFVVPEKFSQEKQELMSALGAKVINTPTKEGMDRAIEYAHELASRQDNAEVPQQFSNPLNAEAHYETTAPEIYQVLNGEVGAIVMGCGTVGTLMGTAKYLREKIPDIYVAAVEPEGSLFSKFLGETPEEADYNIEGIGTHDITTNKLFKPELVDEVIKISDKEAHSEVQRLAQEEGHIVASSSGAASAASLKTADSIKNNEIDAPFNSVVTVFPDSGERYLSRGIYKSYEEWIKSE